MMIFKILAFGALFLAGALAIAVPLYDGTCLACAANNNYYCDGDTCFSDSLDSTGCSGQRYSCAARQTPITSCQTTVDAATLTSVETEVTISLPSYQFCYVTLTGDYKTLKITARHNSIKIHDIIAKPTNWLTSQTLQMGATITPTNGEIKIVLMSEDASTQDAKLGLTDDLPPVVTIGSRSSKCLSCLNPHESLSNDPVYYCTDTKTCESSASTPTCSSITTSKACLTSADKEEDSGCAIVNNVRFSKTAKTVTLPLPPDSFCYIKLIGASKKMKITYPSSSSSAVYYPATGEWDSTTFQTSATSLSATTSTKTNSRLLQGSTTELNVAVVNYNPSDMVTFTIEAEDPTVPDDEPGRLSGGQIAGIVIGSTLFLLVVIVAVAWAVKSWQKKRSTVQIEGTKIQSQKPINHQPVDVVEFSNE